MRLQGLAVGSGFLQGQVGHDQPAHPGFGGVRSQAVQSVLQEGVGVAHQHDVGAQLPPAGAQAFQHPSQGHACFQGAAAAFFDDGAVCHGVGEGYAYLDDVYPAGVDLGQFLPKALRLGESGGDEGDDGGAACGVRAAYGFLHVVHRSNQSLMY